MASGGVESLYGDYVFLRDESLAQDPSGLASLERTYPKVLLLASASYLETVTVAAIKELFTQGFSLELASFVDQHALKRKYHALFEWDRASAGANKFFNSFGQQCKDRFAARFKDDDSFSEIVKAFLEVGNLRNQLVHLNYAEFQLDATTEDIMALHQIAIGFPELIHEVVLPT